MVGRIVGKPGVTKGGQIVTDATAATTPGIDADNPVALHHFKAAAGIEQRRTTPISRKSRMCGDLGYLTYHLEHVERLSKSRICFWCGEDAYTTCVISVVTLHCFPKGRGPTKLGFIHYHSTNMFGLGKKDANVVGKTQNDWSEPSKSVRKSNSQHIKALMSQNES